MIRILLAFCLFFAGAQAVVSETLRLAVTTSFLNSGLADVLLPEIAGDTGLDVQLLAVGTGQAIRLGEAGDVDAILVHSRRAEDDFVNAGFGTHRREIMFNDFVIVGPRSDPAGVAKASSATDALIRIHDTSGLFVSRGDESGTHKKEMGLWQAAGLKPDQFENWYRPVGAGMGAALNTATGMGAYILADRASWLNFSNKADQALLYSGDPRLFNQYAFLPVNPLRHPHVKTDAVKSLETWLTSERARTIINGYQIAGERLFTFNAEPASQ